MSFILGRILVLVITIVIFIVTQKRYVAVVTVPVQFSLIYTAPNHSKSLLLACMINSTVRSPWVSRLLHVMSAHTLVMALTALVHYLLDSICSNICH